MIGDASTIPALDYTPRKRTFQLLWIAYGIAISLAFIYLGYYCYVAEIPDDISGQPRADAIPAGWHVPLALALFYVTSLLSLIVVPWYPVLGVATYLVVAWALPVQKPPWAFTQWIGIRTLIAVLAAMGCVIFLYRSNRLHWPWATFQSRILLVFFGWYAFCTVVAWVINDEYSPVLQFHPSHLFNAFLICTIVLSLPDKRQTMLMVAVTLCITLLARYLFIQGGVYRDADIAMGAALAVPLAMYVGMTARRWWMSVPWWALVFAALWLVYSVENRGAAVGLLMGFFAGMITSKRAVTVLIIMIPFALFGINSFLNTSFGERFTQLADWNKLWLENDRVDIWRGGLRMALDHSLWGVGPGNFVNAIGNYAPDSAYHSAHNVVIDTVAEAGFLGGILYLLMVFTILCRCLRDSWSTGSPVSQCIFVSLGIHLGISMFLTTTMMILPYVLMAIALKSSAREGIVA